MVSKQKVKDYLDLENTALSKEMKEKMDDPTKWSDFKSEFSSLMEKYSKEPNASNKSKLEDLVSKHYVTNSIVGQDALDTVIKALGIREEQAKGNAGQQKKENREAYRRAIYEALGIEYAGDIRRRMEKEFQDKEDEKYGIVRKDHKKDSEKEDSKKSKPAKEKESDKEKEPKEDGKVKKAIKNLYFRLTSSMLMAPGEVPPEMLAENRELVDETSDKLDKVLDELEKAHGIVSSKNNANSAEFPDEIKDLYESMRNEEMDEDALSTFEETLEDVQNDRMKSIRENFEKLQNSKLESELRKILETEFPDMPEKEMAEEIEYAMLDSKVDKNGRLILPARSVFQEIILDERGEADPDHIELVGSLSAYTETPRISDLSNDELAKLSRNFRDLSKMNPESNEYAIAKLIQDHPEMMPDNFDQVTGEIEQSSREYLLTRDVTEEAELLHKLMIAEEVRGQIEDIQDIIQEYDEKEQDEGELTKDDKKKRQLALKIARKKVTSLEKAGLSRIVAEGEKTSKGVIKRAKSILLPNLENARDAGAKKFEKTFVDPEIQEDDEQEQEP